eukprot:comp14686_c0_seq1/m.11058 comp14686_c0_seq1/g.11058  ORF comp14686_c0_seq1/g.11058 comp14686_c0_seq1/m.11058 type:complete len:680 (-) comp14686_c0_seq1:32-2071(-)
MRLPRRTSLLLLALCVLVCLWGAHAKKGQADTIGGNAAGGSVLEIPGAGNETVGIAPVDGNGTTNETASAEGEDGPNPTTVGNVCPDPISINYDPQAKTTDTTLCKYPSVRDTPNTWVSMPDFCFPSFTWDSMGMANCYQAWATQRPPWLRKDTGCKGADCMEPLVIQFINVMLQNFEFDVAGNEVRGAFVYGMKWRDPRLLTSMLVDAENVWRPKVAVNLYITSRGDIKPLELLDVSKSTDAELLYVTPPPCTPEELELIRNNSVDINCCEDDDDDTCVGAMQPFNAYIDCLTWQQCNVQVVERLDFTARMGFIDVTNFPFDSHKLLVEFVVQNPYESTTAEWWLQWKPPAPKLLFEDYGSKLSTVEGSLVYSFSQLNPMQFNTESKATIIANTSLSYLMAQATPGAATKIVSTPHAQGVGGLSIEITLDRRDGFVVRYFAFPMVLVGAVTCMAPMLDDDAAAQVNTRVGFALVAVLTSLVSAQQLTDQTRSQNQITDMDQLSILTMVFGGLIVVEAFVAYVWWRRSDCNAEDPWTCWHVRVMDRSTAVVCTVMYFYLVGVIMLIPQDTVSAILWGTLGFLLCAAVLVIAFFEIRRYAIIARVNPADVNLMRTAMFRNTPQGTLVAGLQSRTSKPDPNKQLNMSQSRKLMATTSKVFDRMAVWRSDFNPGDNSSQVSP